MEVVLPEPAPLCAAEQLVLRLAVPRRSTELKCAVAELLSDLDRFEEALTEYQTIDVADLDAALLLDIAKIHRAIGGPDHVEAARGLLLAELAGDSAEDWRPKLLTELGDIFCKEDQFERARAYFLEALAIAPDDSAALRKYAVKLFDMGRVPELLEYCEKLIAMGVNNTRLRATHFSALAALGRAEEAKAIRGFERFFRHSMIDPPERYDTLTSFNAALTDEIRASPALRLENTRQASEHSWRVDELMTRGVPHVTALLEIIAVHVKEYAASVAEGGPGTAPSFEAAIPDAARIKAWSIITREKGFERWHTHDKGWLSGVYYAAVPQGLSGGEERAGGIEFGWPERLLGAEKLQELGTHLVHPEPGMLLLFPSHIHHRTWPHGTADDRICVSFDVVPQ